MQPLQQVAALLIPVTNMTQYQPQKFSKYSILQDKR